MALRGPPQMFLLAGQSNMSGRGTLPDPATTKDDERLLVLGPDGAWKPAKHPLHYDKPEKAGVGPGLAFAKGVVDFLPGPVALVPCAFGGSEIERWLADGDLFQNAVKRVQRGRELGGVLRGILWHQGESDCSRKEDATQYSRRLQEVLKNFRLACGCADIPFILGELGVEFLAGDTFGFVEMVNSAILEVAATEGPCTAAVSSAGLGHKGDCLHFNSTSAEELGRRYAWRWLEMTGHAGVSLRTLVGKSLDPGYAGGPHKHCHLQPGEGQEGYMTQELVLD